MEYPTLLPQRAITPRPIRPSIGVLHALWSDDRGFIITAELVMIATIVVLGLIAGLTCVRDAVTCELTDVADSIGSLNQSYSYSGMHGCWTPRCGTHAYTAGSAFYDCEDNGEAGIFFDGPCQARPDMPACPVEQPYPIVDQEVIPYVEPCPTQPCPTPCPTPCPEPCPTPTQVPCEPTQSGTIYYDYGPSFTVPQATAPCQPGGAWHTGAPVYPSPIW